MRRVQVKASTLIDTNENVTVETKSEIGLFSDIAVLVQDKSKPPTYRIARVTRMRKDGASRGKVEYTKPIPLNENHKYGYVELTVNMYKSVNESTYHTHQKSNVSFQSGL